MGQFFPFDPTHLAGDQARILFAPLSEPVPVPANIPDVFNPNDPYAPKALVGVGAYAWEDFGATQAPLDYSRDLAVTEWKIQQQTTAVLEEPSAVNRTVKIPMAEFRPQLIQLFENAPEVTALAAAAGYSAADKIPFGTFADIAQYRVAYATKRPKEAGTVTETVASGGKVRGRILMQVLYRCQISAENLQIQFGLGEMAHADITLKLFPEPGQTEGEEYGFWVDEHAGVIA